MKNKSIKFRPISLIQKPETLDRIGCRNTVNTNTLYSVYTVVSTEIEKIIEKNLCAYLPEFAVIFIIVFFSTTTTLAIVRRPNKVV